MTWIAWGQVVLGFVVLVVGAEALVRGAAGLALRLRISPLVVGLTVVAFGTSAPELAVSLWASLHGQAELAVGNVVGSNILNVLLILGLSAALTPLAIDRALLRVDFPLMVGASVVAALLVLDGRLGRFEAALLVLGLLGYLALLARRAHHGRSDLDVPDPGRTSPWLLSVFLVAGLGALVLGSRLLVTGATGIATALGVSDLVIGLTVVALGTSLPEVATSLVAALRGARDLAIGNVVGSNVFNLLAVLGLSGAISPEGLPVPASAISFDLPLMVGVALGAWLLAATGRRLGQAEGAMLLAGYVTYTALLVLGIREVSVTAWLAVMVLVASVAWWDGRQAMRRALR